MIPVTTAQECIDKWWKYLDPQINNSEAEIRNCNVSKINFKYQKQTKADKNSENCLCSAVT